MEQPDIEVALCEESITYMKNKYEAIDADSIIDKLATDAMVKCGVNPQKVIILQRDNVNSYSTLYSKNKQLFMILGIKSYYVNKRYKALDEVRANAYHECGHIYYEDLEQQLEAEQGGLIDDPIKKQEREMRADTFAYKKLLENNDIAAIVGDIINHIDGIGIVCFPYPSNYDRAANGVKILREAGIDFTKVQEIDPNIDSGLAAIAPEKINKYFPESK